MEVFGAQRFAPKPMAKCPTNTRFLLSRHGKTEPLGRIVGKQESDNRLYFRLARDSTTIAKAMGYLVWGLHWAEVSIEPIKAFLDYRLDGRKMPRLEYYVALIRTRHTQDTKQRILR